MAQRILEPGQIEALAERSIPRVRLPDGHVFARRAARLRHLAPTSPMGSFLHLLATLVETQQSLLAQVEPMLPAPGDLRRAHEHGMPPLQATWRRAPQWLETLRALCAPLLRDDRFPAGVADIAVRLTAAPSAWLEAQAAAVLGSDGEIEVAAAPFVMAALQVHWVAWAGQFVAADVHPLDVPGLCPLCGTEPVASVVHAESRYQGYRYLHCALCATEWHLVRVQCSRCGASGKDIGYHSLEGRSVEDGACGDAAAVRAETCEHCHGYRKILYQEKDPGVEPVADDVATFALDLLLAERNYQRASGNPLLWAARPS